MADVDQISGPSTTEPSEEQTSPAVQCTSSTTFCDPLANVVFRTSDSVIFRVHDYYLKAASEFFKDMLDSSVQSSSAQDPIPVDESSNDFEIMLLIITGRPHSVLGRDPQTWEDTERLYRLVDKYQLDGHQHWFSELCAKEAANKPLEALIMACNRPSVDTTLARWAIVQGLPTASDHASPYFQRLANETDYRGYSMSRHMLESDYMTLDFRLRLGFKGVVAYSHTFRGLSSTSPINWNAFANDFVSNVRCIEEKLAGSA